MRKPKYYFIRDSTGLLSRFIVSLPASLRQPSQTTKNSRVEEEGKGEGEGEGEGKGEGDAPTLRTTGRVCANNEKKDETFFETRPAPLLSTTPT